MLLALFLVQTSYRYPFALFGIKPDLIPFFIAALALFEGPACAGVIGFFAGLLCDFTQSGLDGFSPFLYISAGILAGFLSEKFFRKNILSGLVLGMAFSILQNLFKYIFYYALLFQASLLTGMRIIFSELLASVLFAPLVYLAVEQAHGTVEDEEG